MQLPSSGLLKGELGSPFSLENLKFETHKFLLQILNRGNTNFTLKE